jgi:spore coat protein A, manganese oxidase
MKASLQMRKSLLLIVMFLVTMIGIASSVNLPPPTITGPPENTIGAGVTADQVYTTETGMVNYLWTVSSAGQITSGQGTESITVTWTNPTGNQSVSVTYADINGNVPLEPAVYIVLYYPFPAAINPSTIPQFVDPLPHFAAGLRVNAKAGGTLKIKAVPVRQVALSTGTVLSTGTIGPANPEVGKGNYAAYAISTNGGATYGPAMWPAQTIEAQQGNQLVVQYENDLFNMKYTDFNILTDQTLMPSGYTLTGNIRTDPYTGDIPMVVHLHGGEMPSNSDGGPQAWWTPGFAQQGPGFQYEASSLCTYPNKQEGTTLWYHPHDQGLTRINVYTGLAGFYFLRGTYEDQRHLPGWSGDDKVIEITPPGKQQTFNFEAPYLPEIEIAIQDRMFNVKGELYWPIEPTNPEIHPYWTPEFFGDVMTVNGKSWPYLSVAPRKYAFRMLDGCNARFLNLWLSTDTATGVKDGPKITVVSTEGGFLENPVVLDPALGQTLFIAPAERPIIIVDFSGYAPGTVFYLMNDAAAPYPTGDPVIPGLTDRIMQFVVNGQMLTPTGGAGGTDKSVVPSNLRTQDPMVKLTDFNGGLNATPVVKRQMLLNEISGAGGPLTVAVNNSRFETLPANGLEPAQFGGPTEVPQEGTVEVWQVINTTADAHPMHIHLSQWQLVSRQAFNVDAYMEAYSAAWAPSGLPNYPPALGYPGGSGSPYPYNTLNADGAVGGNPAITPFLTGPVMVPPPEERGWKDAIKSYPGEVATYICRFAPTDKPLNAPPAQMIYPFDPSLGPGFVWHCHIIDHEDMDMMRPLPIAPSPVRFPQVTAQPATFTACIGDAAHFTVAATSATTITYKWQVSTDGGTSYTDLVNGGPYANVTTPNMTITPSALAMNGYKYRCALTNIDGTTLSNVATLNVIACSVTGVLKYYNTPLSPLKGMSVTLNTTPPVTSGMSASNGSFTIPSVPSGTYTVTVNPNGKAVGGINATDAVQTILWGIMGGAIEHVKFNSGDVTNNNNINAIDGARITLYWVLGLPFDRAPWTFWRNGQMIYSNSNPNPIPTTYTVTVDHASVSNFNIYGRCTGDFNGSFTPSSTKEGRPNLQLATNSILHANTDRLFELPVRATADMEVSALSLVLNIPGDLVSVEGVEVVGSSDPVTFAANGNELRIGWFSATPVKVMAGEDLLMLKLHGTAAFTKGKTVSITANGDPLNELADGSAEVIPDAVLAVDVVESMPLGVNETTGTVFSLSNYPNPFSTFTTFSYDIPYDGKVTLEVRNMLGAVVTTLVDENKAAGHHTLKMDGRGLASGVYYAALRLSSANDEKVSTIKFIVNK